MWDCLAFLAWFLRWTMSGSLSLSWANPRVNPVCCLAYQLVLLLLKTKKTSLMGIQKSFTPLKLRPPFSLNHKISKFIAIQLEALVILPKNHDINHKPPLHIIKSIFSKKSQTGLRTRLLHLNLIWLLIKNLEVILNKRTRNTRIKLIAFNFYLLKIPSSMSIGNFLFCRNDNSIIRCRWQYKLRTERYTHERQNSLLFF